MRNDFMRRLVAGMGDIKLPVSKLKKLSIKKKDQEGASPLMIVVGVVALLGVIASLFVGGGGSGNISSKGSSSGYASDIIQQGSSLRDAFDLRVSNGTSPSGVCIADTSADGTACGAGAAAMPTSSSSIFYQVDGMGAQTPSFNQTAFISGNTTPMWVVNNSVQMPGIGVIANADYTIGVTGLKSGVCSAINKTLYNSEAIPILANTGASYATAATATTITNSTDTNLPKNIADAIDTDALNFNTGVSNVEFAGGSVAIATHYPAGINGWASGCFADAVGGPYTYIQTVTAR